MVFGFALLVFGYAVFYWGLHHFPGPTGWYRYSLWECIGAAQFFSHLVGPYGIQFQVAQPDFGPIGQNSQGNFNNVANQGLGYANTQANAGAGFPASNATQQIITGNLFGGGNPPPS